MQQEEIVLQLLSKSYKLTLEKELASFVKKDLKRLGLKEEGKNSFELFLSAYLELASSHLALEKEIKNISNKLDKLSS